MCTGSFAAAVDSNCFVSYTHKRRFFQFSSVKATSVSFSAISAEVALPVCLGCKAWNTSILHSGQMCPIRRPPFSGPFLVPLNGRHFLGRKLGFVWTDGGILPMDHAVLRACKKPCLIVNMDEAMERDS